MNDTRALDCEAVLRMIFAYLDGELEGDQPQRVEEHLHRCRSCFSRAEFERRLKSHLAEVGRQEVPAALEHRIRSLLGQFTCS